MDNSLNPILDGVANYVTIDRRELARRIDQLLAQDEVRPETNGYAATPPDTVLTMQAVQALCTERIDPAQFQSCSPALCLDGTSCTGKSSILNQTGLAVSKTSRTSPVKQVNTYPLATFGIVAEGIIDGYRLGVQFFDRAPTNPLEWVVLWSLMQHAKQQPQPLGWKVLAQYRGVFDALADTEHYKLLRAHSNTVVIVDSDVARCDGRRMLRDQSSDVERSSWGYYTTLQNCMYQRLYPRTYIDLAWFGNTPMELVTGGIAAFLRGVQQNTLLARVQPTAPYHEQLVKIQNSLSSPVVVPTGRQDLTSMNVSAHATRALLRNRVHNRSLVDYFETIPLGYHVSLVDGNVPLGSTVSMRRAE